MPNGECILYNPESVFKIQPITLKERVLFLYSKKRIEECIALINKNKDSLPEEIILKVRNAELEVFLSQKKYHEAAKLLPDYCEENPEQWKHWIMKFKHKKSLGFISDIIPVGYPIKLSSDLYSLIFQEFLEQKDFKNLLV